MVRLVPPLFFNVSVWVDVPPTRTSPKLKLVGLVVKAPAETPVPEIAILAEPLSVVTARLPLALPEVVGAKTTLTAALCPAPNVNGVVTPVMLKPVPLTVACVTVMLDPPVLVRVTDRV
jgi:hypothetical protein